MYHITKPSHERHTGDGQRVITGYNGLQSLVREVLWSPVEGGYRTFHGLLMGLTEIIVSRGAQSTHNPLAFPNLSHQDEDRSDVR